MTGQTITVSRDESRTPRKRVWVEYVDPELTALRIQLAAAEAGNLTDSQKAIAKGVQALIDRAQDAVDGRDPVPRRFLTWWRGTLIESAYRNLHAARAQIVALYDEAELAAELPRAISRANVSLHRDDPRRVNLSNSKELSIADRRARLRRLIEDSYDASDLQHAQFRNFRNILLCAAFVISVLLMLAVAVIAWQPTYVPLCFPAADVTPDADDAQAIFNCPTASRTKGPHSADVFVVGLLGLLGGALATSIAIRKISSSTPLSYGVPVALAWLKVPLGAFVAILGLVAVRGGFVPGLSRLDTQEQILAYALLFGFAQQLLTSSLDSKAKSLVEELPSKGEPGPASTAPPSVAGEPVPDPGKPDPGKP